MYQQVINSCLCYYLIHFLSLPLSLSDDALNPQFRLSPTSGKATVRSSARTYFYQDEHKCDENMENFIKCINIAGAAPHANNVHVYIHLTCKQYQHLLYVFFNAADASDGEEAFAAIKLTGLGRTEFLVKIPIFFLF